MPDSWGVTAPLDKRETAAIRTMFCDMSDGRHTARAAMENCLFCRIRDGAIPAKIVHEDDRAFAFRDINPQAPTHVLVVPRKHIASLTDLTEADDALTVHLHRVAAQIAGAER